MSVTDPIADFITCIRNANMVYKKIVEVQSSLVKKQIAEILQKEKFIDKYEEITDGNKKYLRLSLKYEKRKQRYINNFKKISKPGLRVYVDKDDIPWVYRGAGTAVISTSKGILTDKQCRKLGVGGEVLFHVW
jgi:small subunit ribosomal protein S8